MIKRWGRLYMINTVLLMTYPCHHVTYQVSLLTNVSVPGNAGRPARQNPCHQLVIMCVLPCQVVSDVWLSRVLGVAKAQGGHDFQGRIPHIGGQPNIGLRRPSSQPGGPFVESLQAVSSLVIDAARSGTIANCLELLLMAGSSPSSKVKGA